QTGDEVASYPHVARGVLEDGPGTATGSRAERRVELRQEVAIGGIPGTDEPDAVRLRPLRPDVGPVVSLRVVELVAVTTGVQHSVGLRHGLEVAALLGDAARESIEGRRVEAEQRVLSPPGPDLASRLVDPLLVV